MCFQARLNEIQRECLQKKPGWHCPQRIGTSVVQILAVISSDASARELDKTGYRALDAIMRGFFARPLTSRQSKSSQSRRAQAPKILIRSPSFMGYTPPPSTKSCRVRWFPGERDSARPLSSLRRPSLSNESSILCFCY